jgi:hypothetical protein
MKSATQIAIDRLTQTVTDLETVQESAEALIATTAQAIRDSANDPVALNALADKLDADKATLAKAVSDNTPAAAPAADPTATA